MKRYGEELTPASSVLHLIHQLYHPCPVRACMEPFSLAFVHWMLRCSEFSSFFFFLWFSNFPPSLTPASPVFPFMPRCFHLPFCWAASPYSRNLMMVQYLPSTLLRIADCFIVEYPHFVNTEIFP